MPTRLPRRVTATAVLVLAASAATFAQSRGPKPIENPTAADLDRGAAVFAVFCARCHGLDGSGGMGPPLTRPALRRAADDAELIGVITGGIPGTGMPSGWMMSEAEVTRVAAYVRTLGRRPPEPLPGDPEAGLAEYTRLSCAGCHIVSGAGTAVGPELTTIGALRGAAYLRDALFDPAAARPERAVPYGPYSYPAYVVVRVKPRGGAEMTGTRVNEDSFTIQLRDEGGRMRSFRKRDLEWLRPDATAAVMPGYRAALTERQANDLVAYLMTLGTRR